MERREYAEEGVDGTKVAFVDNAPTVDLCLGKEGLLPLLEEECRLPRGGDSTYVSQLRDTLKSHPSHAYVPARSAKDLTFTVKHFAGEVRVEPQPETQRA